MEKPVIHFRPTPCPATTDVFYEAFKKASPQIKKNLEDVMDEELEEWSKMFK